MDVAWKIIARQICRVYVTLFKILKSFQDWNRPCFVFQGQELAVGNLPSNTLNVGDKVLAQVWSILILWVKMCKTYGLDVINCDMGVVLLEDYKAIWNGKNHLIKAVLVCHNETATGVTSTFRPFVNSRRPRTSGASFCGWRQFCRKFGLSDGRWKVDVIVSGSQKSFMLPTGLAIVGVSQKAMDAGKRTSTPRDYFCYATMLQMNEQGYFPYTPPMTLLRGLRASIDMMNAEGLENVFKRHNRLASGVRAAVTAWGLKNCAVDRKWHSDTVTAIRVPNDIDANNVIKTAYHKYGVSLGAGLGPLNGNVFRIGHLSWLNETMVLSTWWCRDGHAWCRYRFLPGCGVGAAIEKYTDTKAPMEFCGIVIPFLPCRPLAN